MGYSGGKFNNEPTEEGALKDRIEKLERLVVRQLQARVLTRENVELLVKMVNEELQTAASGLRDRLEIIDTELRDVRASVVSLKRLNNKATRVIPAKAGIQKVRTVDSVSSTG